MTLPSARTARGPSRLDARIALTHLPTPVEPMERLGRHLGLPHLYVKRDDCTGLAGGGNKARKLEYLCADAVSKGSDWLVTSGACQSNHARLTAAAASKLGFGCTVVLRCDPPAEPSGNLTLLALLDAEVIFAGDISDDEAEVVMQQAATKLQRQGHKPYVISKAGSTAVGTLGYVRAALELTAQLPSVDLVVVATGSGGTHAGLVAGLGDHARVVGVKVGLASEETVGRLALEVAELAGLRAPSGVCKLDTSQLGDGYGALTVECQAAIRLAARLEGIVLDPVYTGKAMAGLVAMVERRIIGSQSSVVFLHTGGLPGLLARDTGHWLHPRVSTGADLS